MVRQDAKSQRKGRLQRDDRYGENAAGKWVRSSAFRKIDYDPDNPDRLREFDNFDAAFAFNEESPIKSPIKSLTKPPIKSLVKSGSSHLLRDSNVIRFKLHVIFCLCLNKLWLPRLESMLPLGGRGGGGGARF